MKSVKIKNEEKGSTANSHLMDMGHTVKLKNQLKRNVKISFLTLFLEICLLTIFLSYYIIDPVSSIFIFLILIIICVIFFNFLMKSIDIYGQLKSYDTCPLFHIERTRCIDEILRKMEGKALKNEEQNRKRSRLGPFYFLYSMIAFIILQLKVWVEKLPLFIHKLITKIETFPSVRKQDGIIKKNIFKFFGWALLAGIYCGSLIYATILEIQSSHLIFTISDWFLYLAFSLFFLSLMTILLSFLSKTELSRVFKINILVFSLLYLLPPLLDYFIMSPARVGAYSFVEWQDALIYFSLFFLNQNTTYATQVGHFVLSILLIGFSMFYVFFRSYYNIELNVKRNLLVSLVQAIFCGFLTYLIFFFVMISSPYIHLIILTLNGQIYMFDLNLITLIIYLSPLCMLFLLHVHKKYPKLKPNQI